MLIATTIAHHCTFNGSLYDTVMSMYESGSITQSEAIKTLCALPLVDSMIPRPVRGDIIALIIARHNDPSHRKTVSDKFIWARDCMAYTPFELGEMIEYDDDETPDDDAQDDAIF